MKRKTGKPASSHLTPEERVVLAAAKRALRQAHAPYSRFRVGAALRTEDGRVFTGCNVENASYGLTICAERVAIFTAIAAGARRFQVLAVVADGAKPPYPCGGCRQVLAEFIQPSGLVLVAPAGRLSAAKRFTLQDLLPHRFER